VWGPGGLWRHWNSLATTTCACEERSEWSRVRGPLATSDCLNWATDSDTTTTGSSDVSATFSAVFSVVSFYLHWVTYKILWPLAHTMHLVQKAQASVYFPYIFTGLQIQILGLLDHQCAVFSVVSFYLHWITYKIPWPLAHTTHLQHIAQSSVSFPSTFTGLEIQIILLLGPPKYLQHLAQSSLSFHSSLLALGCI